MLNCRCQGNETRCRARIKNRVCMCIVYQRVSLSPTLSVSGCLSWFSVRVRVCERSRVRCWSRAYPHRHDWGGVGWSGCRMATYGTKLHAYTETEFSFPLFLSLFSPEAVPPMPTTGWGWGWNRVVGSLSDYHIGCKIFLHDCFTFGRISAMKIRSKMGYKIE